MRRLPWLALSLVGFAFISQDVAAQIGPPTTWELFQNDPNPFCSNPGATRIDFAVPQSASVELVVLSPDGTQVVRTLTNGMLAVGLFSVVWDGRDANNLPVAEGAYPYRMTATDAQAVVLFQGTKTATVECVLSIQPEAWESVKQRYR